MRMVFFALAAVLAAPAQEPALVPAPVSYQARGCVLELRDRYTVEATGVRDPLVDALLTRTKARLLKKTGVDGKPGSGPAIRVAVAKPAGAAQQPVEDESYSLAVDPSGATLTAATPFGAMRGMETLLQLFSRTPSGWAAPCAEIRDQPRFAWRGLMLDVARHFLPLPDVLRAIDGMALVKLNVLHLHLTDDQGFRVESKRYPKLHAKGAKPGEYFQQDEIRRIVAYARERGIRVVPEFDVPGHTTAWLAGYPELGSAPGPYAPETKFGVFDAALDPSNEAVYTFLDGLIAEMAALFPDPYFHIGGDEVNGKQWEANPRIKEYRLKNGWKSYHDLQAYFVRRVSAIVQKHGKLPVAWDEVLSPDLPRNVTVQAWRGQKSIAAATAAGRPTVVSTGYYLDWMLPASFHYQRDPAAPNAAWNDRYDNLLGALVPGNAPLALTAEQAALVLGGDAPFWSEMITPLNFDIRLWPRLAAVAERFWSPAARRDADSLYKRLEWFSMYLESEGIPHQTRYMQQLRRLAGDQSVDPLIVLAGALEPAQYVVRILSKRYTTESPMNRLADVIRPESLIARRFGAAVEAYLRDRSGETAIREALEQWRQNHSKLAPALERSELAEAAPVSAELAEIGSIGLEALDALAKRVRLPAERTAAHTAKLRQAAEPKRELRIAVAAPVLRLVEAAASR